MRQDSHEFIVDGRYEAAIAENDWEERPVVPNRRKISVLNKV